MFGKIQASLGILGGTLSQLGGGFRGLGSIISGFAAGGIAGAAAVGIGEIIGGLQGSVKAAAESEQAFKNLSIAVQKSGTSWLSVEAGTRTALTAMQKVTVFSDEQLAGTLQRLMTFGMSYGDALKALGTVTDLAAAKQIDLDTAAGLVGKAFQGNTTLLQRYGINVQTSADALKALSDVFYDAKKAIETTGTDALKPFTQQLKDAGVSLTETATKNGVLITSMRDGKYVISDVFDAFQHGKLSLDDFTKIMGALGVKFDASKITAATFADVMKQLNEQFGGTAKEQVKTYTGMQEQLKNQVSELAERIGGALLPALSGIVTWMMEATGATITWIDSLKDDTTVQRFLAAFNQFKLSGDLDTVMAFLGKVATEVFHIALEVAIAGMGAFSKLIEGMNFIMGHNVLGVDIKINIPGIEGTTFATSIGEMLSRLFDQIVNDVLRWSFILKAIVEGLALAFASAVKIIQDPIGEISADLDFLWQKWKEFADWLGSAFNVAFGSGISASLMGAFAGIDWGAILATFTAGLSSLPTTVTIQVNALISDALAGFQQVIAGIMAIPRTIAVTITTLISDAIAGIQAVISALAGIVDKVVSIFVNWQVPAFPSLGIPGFQTGGILPYTGLFFGHEGEEVLTPAQQAASAPSSSGQGSSSTLSLENKTLLSIDGQIVASVVENKFIQRRKLASAYG